MSRLAALSIAAESSARPLQPGLRKDSALAGRSPTGRLAGVEITCRVYERTRQVFISVIGRSRRVLACPRGQGRMKRLAVVENPLSIAGYLAAVGEPTEVYRARSNTQAPLRPRPSDGRPTRPLSPGGLSGKPEEQ